MLLNRFLLIKGNVISKIMNANYECQTIVLSKETKKGKLLAKILFASV